MQAHLEQFSVMRMAKVLAVSRSGFYYWLKHRNEISQRDRARTLRDIAVKKASEASKGRDGARRIQVERTGRAREQTQPQDDIRQHEKAEPGCKSCA